MRAARQNAGGHFDDEVEDRKPRYRLTRTGDFIPISDESAMSPPWPRVSPVSDSGMLSHDPKLARLVAEYRNAHPDTRHIRIEVKRDGRTFTYEEDRRDPRPVAAIQAGGDNGSRAPRREATPLARRLAEQADVDLSEVKGTGPGGRVIQRDVEAYLNEASANRGFPAAVTPAARPSAERDGADPGVEALIPGDAHLGKPGSAMKPAVPTAATLPAGVPQVLQYTILSIDGQLTKIGAEIQGLWTEEGVLAQRTVIHTYTCPSCTTLIKEPERLGGRCECCGERLCVRCTVTHCQGSTFFANGAPCLSVLCKRCLYYDAFTGRQSCSSHVSPFASLNNATCNHGRPDEHR